MYQKLSKEKLITKLLEVESERNNLVSLYLTADSLLKDSTAYIDLSTLKHTQKL